MERILLTSMNAGSNICWIIWTVEKFHSLLFSTYCYGGSLCVFAKGKNIFIFFAPFFLETVGNVFWNQISHDKFQLQEVLHQFGLCSSVERTDQPNVNGANGAVFDAQLTKSTPWWIKIKAGIREDPIEVEISCSGALTLKTSLSFSRHFLSPM